MAGGALIEPVRRDGEREPADRRRPGPELERAQPEVREEARGHDRPEEEQVPRDDGPEERAERPVDEAERPAGEHGLRLGERLEAVGVLPGRRAVRQLVADEPEAVDASGGGRRPAARRSPSPPLAMNALPKEPIAGQVAATAAAA